MSLQQASSAPLIALGQTSKHALRAALVGVMLGSKFFGLKTWVKAKLLPNTGKKLLFLVVSGDKTRENPALSFCMRETDDDGSRGDAASMWRALAPCRLAVAHRHPNPRE